MPPFHLSSQNNGKQADSNREAYNTTTASSSTTRRGILSSAHLPSMGAKTLADAAEHGGGRRRYASNPS
eukprot:757349-Hanusia_phi.AAC.1